MSACEGKPTPFILSEFPRRYLIGSTVNRGIGAAPTTLSDKVQSGGSLCCCL